jgi:hypothetical protein
MQVVSFYFFKTVKQNNEIILPGHLGSFTLEETERSTGNSGRKIK